MNNAVNVAIIGHVRYDDPAMTAGVGLGHAFKVMLGVNVIIGVNSGMETFVNQAIGAKQLKLAGLNLRQGRLIAFLTFLPCCLILFNVERLLLLCGQDPKVAKYA